MADSYYVSKVASLEWESFLKLWIMIQKQLRERIAYATSTCGERKQLSIA